jgi:hypothetical protein
MPGPAITAAFLLSPDVLLVPVAELPEEVRRRLDPEEGDWAITHPRARTPSRLLAARSAELVGEFHQASTIVDAVLRFSQARDLDPESTLVEAYPLLERLLSAGFLVAAGSEEAGGIGPSLQPGARVGGFEVLESVQVLEDTEVYLARGEDGTVTSFVALKVERAAGRAAPQLAREASILVHLDGVGGGLAPRLLGAGELDGRRWLALAWLPGADALTAAGELRRGGDRAGLLALGRSIVAAYASLHARGVIHGDVHPRNVLMAPGGGVMLIDFGLSGLSGHGELPEIAGRGGVAFFFEPEYARAARAGESVPTASAAGEQYALAALLYQLLAGHPTHDFKLARDEMLRQIAEEPPLPFAARDAAPWPAVEEVLARALAKSPAERFASLADFAQALDDAADAAAPPREELRRPLLRSGAGAAAEALLGRVLDRLGIDGPLFREGLPEPPRASVTYGAAGIACALHRIAAARDDAALLALADLWITKAAALSAPSERPEIDEAFYRPESRLVPEILGRVSPYHTASGVHVVRAMIARAQGDTGSWREAVAAFVAASLAPCPSLDLTLGRSGSLLAAALLLDAAEEPPAALRALGEGLLAGLWEEIAALPPIPDCGGRPNLALAHGWAGFLYASLRWCRASGTPLPDALPARLDELAAEARPAGRGVRWRWHAESGADVGTMAGWCNGSAGFVYLWTLAHRTLGDPRFGALAEGAAWNAWEDPARDPSLCCGLAGRAYALLTLHRHGGGAEWLERARDLAERAAQMAARNAARHPEPSHSLYKGEVGLAVLAADLADPAGAAFPFFAEEGWAEGK